MKREMHYSSLIGGSNFSSSDGSRWWHFSPITYYIGVWIVWDKKKKCLC